MVRPVCRDIFLLSQKSAPADKADLPMAMDLADTLRIGLSGSILPTAETPVLLTTGVSGETSGFTSDMAGYMVITESGALKLVVLPVFGSPDFTLPGNITAIETSAFEGAAMTVVSIPDGCESIGDYAFRDCLSLGQIRIPEGCALGTDVFDGCALIYVFGAAGSPAETYCVSHGNCVFVAEE